MARTAEQKATLRTVIIAGVLALITSAVVRYFQTAPTAARHESGELARALKRSAVTALELKAHAADADAPAYRGRHDRALEELSKLATAQQLDGATLTTQLSALPGSVDRVNELLQKKLTLHAYADDAKHIAVYRPLTTLTAAAIPVPLVHMLGEPLFGDHMDDWLMRDAARPAISTRGLARQIVDLFIAAAGEPGLCPVEVRLQSHLALGVEIDGVYRAAVEKAGGIDKEKVMPLCRRERLRRLTHEELLAKDSRFPFVPSLLMSETEIALLERLQDPEKTPGLGGKPRSYMNSMQRADDEIHASIAALTPVVEKLGGELAYEAAVFTGAYAATTKPEDRERCALLATYAASPNPLRFAASQVARVSGESWPQEPERSGLLAFLYTQASLTPPKEAMASGPQMTKIWDVLKTQPKAQPCSQAVATPFAQVIDTKTAQAIAQLLLAE